MPVSPKPGSSPFCAAWSPSTAAGRSELATGSAGELAARPRPGAGMSTSITHLWRLVRWGRNLARHGALKGIESDPLTPPRVRLLCRVARFGARVPKQPAYAGASQAIGPAALKLGQA